MSRHFNSCQIQNLFLFCAILVFGTESKVYGYTESLNCKSISSKHEEDSSYFDDKHPKQLRCILGGVADGPSVEFWENGNRKSEGRFVSGKMTGKWSRWHSNGNRKDIGNWESGKPQGLWSLWHQNGQKQAEGSFVFGDRNGIWTFWDESGNILENRKYIDSSHYCRLSPSPNCGPRNTIVQTENAKQNRLPAQTSGESSKQEMSLLGKERWIRGWVGLGEAFQYYQETDKPDFSSHSLSIYARGFAQFWWIFFGEADTNFTPVNLVTNSQTSRILNWDISGKAGMKFDFFSDRFSLMAAVGVFYGKMISLGSTFGYGDLFYPILYPLVKVRWSNRNSSEFYFRYAPITDAFFAFSGTEREFSAGATWIYRLTNFLGVGARIHWSDLAFSLSSGRNIRSTSTQMNLLFQF